MCLCVYRIHVNQCMRRNIKKKKKEEYSWTIPELPQENYTWYSLVIIRASCGKLTLWHTLTSINLWLGYNMIMIRNRVFTYLGRNSVTIERFGARVTAPMKRTTFGCLSLFIIRTLQFRPQVQKNISNFTYLEIPMTAKSRKS